MAGRAVATMVWSTTARNIGSMMEGKTVRNRRAESVIGSISAFIGHPCAQVRTAGVACVAAAL
jgi:hypothetical protein